MKRTVVVICFLLFAFSVSAQTDGTDTQSQTSGTAAPVCNDLQDCVDIAQQFADYAQTVKQQTLDVYNNAHTTTAADTYNCNFNGVCDDAKLQADTRVENAVSQDYANALNAAQTAQDFASNTETAAQNGDLAGAQAAASNAMDQCAQAQNALYSAQIHNPPNNSTNNSTDNNTNNNTEVPIGDPTTDEEANAITNKAINDLANDPSQIAAQQQQMNDTMNLFKTTTTPTSNVQSNSDNQSNPDVQSNPDDSGGGGGGGHFMEGDGGDIDDYIPHYFDN